MDNSGTGLFCHALRPARGNHCGALSGGSHPDTYDTSLDNAQANPVCLAGLSATALPTPEENTHYAECFLVQIIVLVFSNGDRFAPCCNVDGTLRSLPFTSRFGFTTFRLYKDKLHTSHDEPDCRIPSDPTNNLHTIVSGSC